VRGPMLGIARGEPMAAPWACVCGGVGGCGTAWDMCDAPLVVLVMLRPYSACIIDVVDISCE
jgi:hypothetical protein